jgi:hypothetical protein
MVLPTGQAVSVETVAKICDIIRTAFESAPEVRAALASK